MSKEKQEQQVKENLQKPDHKVEVDTPAKPEGVNHQVKIEGDLKIDTGQPIINLTPKVEEKEQKWDYTNTEGHGIKFNIDTSDPNFSNKQKVEQKILEKEGLVERDLKLNLGELSEEELKDQEDHNKNAIHGIRINPKVMEAIKHKKEHPIGFNAKSLSKEKSFKKKSSLQFDPKNMFNSNKFE